MVAKTEAVVLENPNRKKGDTKKNFKIPARGLLSLSLSLSLVDAVNFASTLFRYIMF